MFMQAKHRKIEMRSKNTLHSLAYSIIQSAPFKDVKHFNTVGKVTLWYHLERTEQNPHHWSLFTCINEIWITVVHKTHIYVSCQSVTYSHSLLSDSCSDDNNFLWQLPQSVFWAHHQWQQFLDGWLFFLLVCFCSKDIGRRYKFASTRDEIISSIAVKHITPNFINSCR